MLSKVHAYELCSLQFIITPIPIDATDSLDLAASFVMYVKFCDKTDAKYVICTSMYY